MTSAASQVSSPVGIVAGGGAMPFAVADSLAARHGAMRKVRLTSAATLHGYLKQLERGIGELGPAERFLVRRLEGLGRLTGLK
jgi:DUF1009 family protein